MRRILTLLMALGIAANVFASQSLWVGIDENATIGDGGLTVASWLAELADPDAASFRIKIGETILDDQWGIALGWIGDPGSGYLSPGQKQNQYRLPDDITDETVITYEIGEAEYVPSADDYVWVFTVGYAQDTYGNLFAANHTYTIGTISPPGETDWTPNHYFTATPSPEPSVAVLLVVGLAMFLTKRHCRQKRFEVRT